MEKQPKKTSKKLNWALTLCAAVAIGIILCVIVEMIPETLTSADLTQEKLHTISDKTKEVLKGLEEKVYIYALYDRIEGEEDTGTQGKAEIIQILDLYDSYDKVEVEYIDLNKNPKFLQETVGTELATQYSSDDYVVKSGDHVIQVTEDDLYEKYEMTTEEMYEYYLTYYEIPTVTSYVTGLAAERAFTGSILRAVNDSPVIYYDTGYGENDIANYDTLTEYLYNCGFDIKAFDLSTNEIPEDAACLIFFGPHKDLTDKSRETLIRWLREGNSAFFFMDIVDITDNTQIIYDEFPYFNEIFENYGMQLENTLVTDSDDYMVASDDNKIIRMDTIKTGALENTSSGQTINVVDTRSIDVTVTADNGEATSILRTSSNGKREFLSGTGSKKTGLVTCAASGTYNYLANTSKICVFGSSATFSDSCLSDFGADVAKKIIYSSLTWMDIESESNVESLIPLREYSYSYLSATETQEKVIALVTMIIIPAIILLIGVVVFFRRRHL